MRWGPKTLLGVLVVLLLALGPAACGDDGESSSTTTAADQAPAESKSGGSASKGRSGNEGESASPEGGKEADGDFVPRQHDDSGGGSEQFKAKGGDNSVQEFGAEADTSELDAAATVLHNFLDASAEGDWEVACQYMSKPTIESFEKTAARAEQIEDKSCGGILEKLTNPAARPAMKAEAARADVGSLRIEGERAFVIYRGLNGIVLAMPMAKEDGSWKVTSLSGTPIN